MVLSFNLYESIAGPAIHVQIFSYFRTDRLAFFLSLFKIGLCIFL